MSTERIEKIRTILNQTPPEERDSSELALAEVFESYDALLMEIATKPEPKESKKVEAMKEQVREAALRIGTIGIEREAALDDLRKANAIIESRSVELSECQGQKQKLIDTLYDMQNGMATPEKIAEQSEVLAVDVQQVMIDHAVQILNEALALDPSTITRMMMNRFMCTQALADHPSIIADDMGPTVGPLGIINGIFGLDEDGNGSIAAVIDESTGLITGFQRRK